MTDSLYFKTEEDAERFLLEQGFSKLKIQDFANRIQEIYSQAASTSSDPEKLFFSIKNPKIRAALLIKEVCAKGLDPNEELEKFLVQSSNKAKRSPGRPKNPPPEIPEPEIIDASDLYDAELPPIYYAVDELIPEGLTILAAPPKTGKSWLCLDMCLRISKGEPFLGFNTKESEVLYLALEDGKNFEQGRLRKVTNERPPKSFHLIFKDIMPMDEGFIEQLDGVLKKIPGIKLIVIDTLSRISPKPKRSESAYSHDYSVGVRLKTYADNHGLAIVVVHHTTKLVHPEDALANVTGTNGLTGSADAVIVITKAKRTDSEATLFISGRHVPQSIHRIAFEKDSCRWTHQGEINEETEELLERMRLTEDYLSSPVRTAVKKIVAKHGTFEGFVTDIIRAAASEKVGIGLPPLEIGKFLCKKVGYFMEHDEILIEILSNGTGSNKYRLSGEKTNLDGFSEANEDEKQIFS